MDGTARLMAYIQRRVNSKGAESWRVGWRDGDGAQQWSPTIWTGDGAAEMKELVESIGPDAALRVLKIRTGRQVTSAAPLLRDYVPRHLAALEADCTPGTVAEYRRLADRTFLIRLGALPLDAITRETVQTWVAWQRRQIVKRTGEPYSAKSIRNAHGLLSSILARAVDDKSIPVTENAAYRTRLPHDQVEAEPEVLTEDEYLRVEAGMQEHYRPYLRFLVATGCRPGEATALQVQDVDLAASTIRIRRAWKKDEHGVYLGAPKSRRSKRPIKIGPTIVADLERLTGGKARDALVFTSVEGQRITSQHFGTRQWRKALKRAGITRRVRPYDLRHTSATWQLLHGESPMVVQRRMGHESLATTSKIYAHLMTEDQASSAAMLDAAVARQIGP